MTMCNKYFSHKPMDAAPRSKARAMPQVPSPKRHVIRAKSSVDEVEDVLAADGAGGSDHDGAEEVASINGEDAGRVC